MQSRNRERLHAIAMITALALLMLAVVPAKKTQGADQTAGGGTTQSSPVLEQPVPQGNRTPTARSGEPMPRLPDPLVTRKITLQPTVTSVFPNLLSPGKGYTLSLQGQALTQQMALNFGAGITLIAGSFRLGTGGASASVMVQVAPDAVPGMRTVMLDSASAKWQ